MDYLTIQKPLRFQQAGEISPQINVRRGPNELVQDRLFEFLDWV